MSAAPKWDRTASVGLAAIIAVILASVLITLAVTGRHKNTTDPIVSATNVDLPTAHLTAAESLVSPLLKTDVDAFADIADLNVKQAVTAILSDIAYTQDVFQNDDGAYIIDREAYEARFYELFGFSANAQSIAQAADFDGVNDAYVFTPEGYHGEYVVKVVSTGTLGDTVYVTAQAMRLVEPVIIPVESEPEEEFEEPSDGVEPDGVSPDDTVSEDGDESDADHIESDVESEPESEPEDEYEIIKSAVFTIVYTESGYHITAMRYT